LYKLSNAVKKMNLTNLKGHRFLIGIVVLSLVLRLLWLNVVIGGDEGLFGYDAMLWSQGYLPYVYSASGSQMPLLYVLFLIQIHFFGNTIIPVRMLNNILFLISIVILYCIAKDWYDKRVGLIAALFYGIFMNAPVFEAQQAMSEPLSVPFVIFSIYFCSRYIENGRKRTLFISGMAISAASLIRQTQALGIFLLLFMIILGKRKHFRKRSEIKQSFIRVLVIDILVLVLGILLPILPFIVYFWSHGALVSLIEGTVFFYFKTIHYFSMPDVPLGIKFLILVEGLPLWLFSIFGFIICILRHDRFDTFLMVWTLIFLFYVVIPPTFGHHYAQVIAQGSILSAISLATILSNIVKSGSIKKFFRNYKQNITSIFIITILITSFVPSIFLQTKQFPNLDIHWEFIDWGYGGDPGPWTYEKQLELGSYLRAHVSENGQVLVYGWVATAYWLSGHRAPSKYVLTLKGSTRASYPYIPEEEFQRVADMVRDGIFEYIVLFSPDLERLEWRRDADPIIEYDPIVDYTLQKYFYVKNISYAQIFSKYNSNGEYIEYLFMEHFAGALKEYKMQKIKSLFIENFSDALKEYKMQKIKSLFIENFSDALKEYKMQNGTIGDTEKDFEKQWAFIPEVSWLNISGDARDAIRHAPIISAESYIRYNNVSIPPNSKLRFGIATDPTSWYREGGDGVQFKIYIEDGDEVNEVFNEYINPKQNITQRKWNDYEINLTMFGGRNVNITFVTAPGPANDNYDDWAYWGDPHIYDETQTGRIGDTEKDFEKQQALIPEVSWLNVSGDARDAIRHAPISSAESYIRYNNVSIPPNSKLRFGIATDPTSWYREGGDGAEFKIYIENGENVDVVFSECINPKQNITQRKWNDYEIDLTELSGKNVNMTLVTTPGPANDNYDDWAYWGDPQIYDGTQTGRIGDTEKDFENQTALIPRLSRLNVSGDVRDAIRHAPISSAESYIRYNNVSIPPNSKLRFGIAMDPATWYREGGDGAEFKIYIEYDGTIDEVLSELLDPKNNIEERKWNDYEIDLTAYGGKNVNIIFALNPGPADDIYDDWAYWSAPKIYVK